MHFTDAELRKAAQAILCKMPFESRRQRSRPESLLAPRVRKLGSVQGDTGSRQL